MPRVVLYSHDTMGLGHVRRNLRLAEAISEKHPDAAVLLISGTHIGGAFRMPPQVDCLTLPSYAKDQNGKYRSRHLAIDTPELTALRSRIIRGAVETFEPDIVLVDNVPLGALRELEPVLASVKATLSARVVLGLRDIIDDPATVQREWGNAGHHEAIARYYDHVWVYGDPQVYDVARECRFPAATCERTTYVGYLNRSAPLDSATSALLSRLQRAFTLCVTGGGQDGGAVALAFARAEFPIGEAGVLVGGPFLPDDVRQEIEAVAAERSDLVVVNFVEEVAPLVAAAARVVGMAGYNSVCEILSYRKPALLVPREFPRREQAIRAQCFKQLGLVDVLSPRRLTSEALAAWFEQPPVPPADIPLRFTALDSVPHLVSSLTENTTSDSPADFPRTHHVH